VPKAVIQLTLDENLVFVAEIEPLSFKTLEIVEETPSTPSIKNS